MEYYINTEDLYRIPTEEELYYIYKSIYGVKKATKIIIMLRYKQVLKELIDVVNKKNLRKLLLEEGIFTEDATGKLFDMDGYEVVCFGN